MLCQNKTEWCRVDGSMDLQLSRIGQRLNKVIPMILVVGHVVVLVQHSDSVVPFPMYPFQLMVRSCGQILITEMNTLSVEEFSYEFFAIVREDIRWYPVRNDPIVKENPCHIDVCDFCNEDCNMSLENLSVIISRCWFLFSVLDGGPQVVHGNKS